MYINTARLPDVIGINLNPETSYPDSEFSYVSSISKGKMSGRYLKLGPKNFHTISSLLFINHPDILTFFSGLLKALLNKP